MNGLMPVLSQPWAQALAWTLIHFIWQGAAIGLGAWLALRTLRLSSRARYGAGVAAMALMLAAPVATFALAMAGQAATAPPLGIADAELAPAPAVERPASLLAGPAAGAPAVAAPGVAAPYLPFVLFAWAAGVVVLSIRLLGGWIVARRLATRALRPVSPEVHAMARRVAGRIALDRIVRLFESTAVAVPVTVGWLKPVVLLPASAMSGLSPTQLEALLAHELAHVRRHDYLVNLLQSAVETLLFYHPAVWWASRVIRAEREHCCDDVAVGVCDRLIYVSALSELAAMAATPRVAMAATSGPLLSRVRRLLGQPGDDGMTGSSWVPAALVLLLAATIVPVVLAQSSGAGTARGDAQSAVGSGVNTGVVAGVSQGVRGGVATGVSGGVAGGVAGGVGTGVRGGVASGVGTGVARGVSGRLAVAVGQLGGDAQAADVQAERRRREVQIERALADLRARLESEQVAIEQARARVEMEFAEQEAATRLAVLRAELQAAEQEIERTRRLVETGLASESRLLEQQAQVARIQTAMRQAELEMARQRQEMQLRLRELRLRDEYGEQVRDLETALAAARARGEIGTRGAAAEDAEARVAELRAELERSQRAMEAQVETARRNLEVAAARSERGEAEYALIAEATEEVTDANALVQERDILVIRISGESQLPTSYRVDADGAIRLPLLGTVLVRGLTAAGVQTAVSDMLADRQLARGATITVTLRRPRVP